MLANCLVLLSFCEIQKTFKDTLNSKDMSKFSLMLHDFRMYLHYPKVALKSGATYHNVTSIIFIISKPHSVPLNHFYFLSITHFLRKKFNSDWSGKPFKKPDQAKRKIFLEKC